MASIVGRHGLIGNDLEGNGAAAWRTAALCSVGDRESGPTIQPLQRLASHLPNE
jgi:hypothetical protein